MRPILIPVPHTQQIPLGRLSADPSWRLAYLDRVWRMLAANKNHSCIVLWSLGNESGDGENLAACRRLVKKVTRRERERQRQSRMRLAGGTFGRCTSVRFTFFEVHLV